MSLVSKAIASLFNGVSQQPATLRLPSQCEALVNGYPTVADGLAKRPPTQHLALLSGLAAGDAFVHFINRSSTERYLVVIRDESLKVYSLIDGSAETLVFNDADDWASTHAYTLGAIVRPSVNNKFHYRCTTAGTTAGSEPTWPTTLGGTVTDGTVTWTAIPNYLAIPNGALASESYSVVTVADYSFIVNKTVTVATGEIETSAPLNFDHWFFPDNWKTSGDDTRYYVASSGTDKGSVQTMADLPALDDPSPPISGDYYTIVGDNSTSFAKYYVYFNGGVWIETYKKGASLRLDEATMPHALVRESDNSFHFRQFGWVPRFFGDDNTNPAPSFVGKQLTDIGYFKNRLLVSAGENIVFSCAGDYGNFFRNTVTQLLDSDRVDVAISTAKVAQINWLLPAENGLMFFADSTQFVLNVKDLLTPSTVSIDVATSYEMNSKVKPLDIGQDVYFPTTTGDFSRMRQYILGDGGQLATDATDITAHTPRYLPDEIFKIAGSSNEDLLLAISSRSGHENRVYKYKYFYVGGQKVQSAWSYWEFGADDVVRSIAMLDSEIYFVIERADGLYLEKMNIQSTDFPLSLTFDVLLDRRYLFEGGDKSYDGSTYTTFTLPYPLASAAEKDDFRLVHASGATPGKVLDPGGYVWLSSTSVKAPGDHTAVEVLGGENYTFTFEFSEQFFPRRDGAVLSGRFQLRTFTVFYAETAFFQTSVDPYGDDPTIEDVVTTGLRDFTGKTLGSASLTVGSPTFETGSYSFQIYGDSRVAVVKILNDEPFASRLVSAEVEALYSNRAAAL